jgi:recombinational DNA repair protein (RecF pathway)
VILKFQLSLLSLSGYKPNFDTCVECGKTAEEGFFSIIKGGVFCNDCRKDKVNGFLVSKGLLSKEDLRESDLEAAFNHVRLLFKFIEYHTGKEVKSSKFLEELKR